MTYDELKTLKKDLSGLCDRLNQAICYVNHCQSGGLEVVDYDVVVKNTVHIMKKYKHYPVSKEFKHIRKDLIQLRDRVTEYLSVTKNKIESKR